MCKKSLALTAAAIVAGVMALSGATANAAHRMFIPPMGGMGGMHGMHQSMMHRPMMGGMGGGMGGMREFHRGGDDWWRHHHHDHDHSFVFLNLGYPYYGDYGYDDYYYPSYGYGYAGDAHTRWCYAHHRSYDPASDTFIGADGYRHYCRGYY